MTLLVVAATVLGRMGWSPMGCPAWSLSGLRFSSPAWAPAGMAPGSASRAWGWPMALRMTSGVWSMRWATGAVARVLERGAGTQVRPGGGASAAEALTVVAVTYEPSAVGGGAQVRELPLWKAARGLCGAYGARPDRLPWTLVHASPARPVVAVRHPGDACLRAAAEHGPERCPRCSQHLARRPRGRMEDDAHSEVRAGLRGRSRAGAGHGGRVLPSGGGQEPARRVHARALPF